MLSDPFWFLVRFAHLVFVPHASWSFIFHFSMLPDPYICASCFPVLYFWVLQAALSGSELKGSLYSGHSTSVQFMYIGLGIGMKRPDIASAFALEIVRDQGTGQIFARGSELVLDTGSDGKLQSASRFWRDETSFS